MTRYFIQRSTETPEGSLIKFVSMYETMQEALDTLYRAAKRYGYKVAVDNNSLPQWGFCLWQIYVQVGSWRYFVTEECDEGIAMLLS